MDVYEESKETLQEIVNSGADIAVIGGWAIWAYNPYKYSLDIDIVVGPKDVWKVRKGLLDKGFSETSGAHLGKKGFRKASASGVIEVDLYDEEIGPYLAKDVLARSWTRKLFGQSVKVASPTDLFVLKLRALAERKDSWKGEKDLSDLVALLMVARDDIDVETIRNDIPLPTRRLVISLLISSYQQVSKFYPLSMNEYKKLKAGIRKWIS